MKNNDTDLQQNETEQQVQDTETMQNFEAEMQIEQPEFETETEYTEQNPGLDEFVKTASEPVLKATDKKCVSEEQACEIALKGLSVLNTAFETITDVSLTLTDESKMLFAALTYPLVQKVSKHISLDFKNVDLDSRQPELLATGALLYTFAPAAFKVRKMRKQQKAAKDLQPEPPPSETENLKQGVH